MIFFFRVFLLLDKQMVLFSDLFILVLLFKLGIWFCFFGGKIFFGLISILLQMELKVWMILWVCFSIGFWLLLIGIRLVLKVVMLVVWLIGQVKKLVGIEWLKFFCWILVLMVGLCFKWEMVIRLRQYKFSLVRVGIWDCMKRVDLVGFRFIVRQLRVILVREWWIFLGLWVLLVRVCWLVIMMKGLYLLFFCILICLCRELM